MFAVLNDDDHINEGDTVETTEDLREQTIRITESSRSEQFLRQQVAAYRSRSRTNEGGESERA